MRLLLFLLAALLSACAPPAKPPDPDLVRQKEITGYVLRLGDAEAERALVHCGEEAMPQLRVVLKSDPSPVRRGRSACVIGQIRRISWPELGIADYTEALRETESAAVVRELLAHAHYFDAPDVVKLLLAYIEKMPGVTPSMIASAAALTETDAMSAMKSYIVRTKTAGSDPSRALAVRYLGRAGRHGRPDAIEFLVDCTAVGADALAVEAERELILVAGRTHAQDWRGWWLEHGRERRFTWIAQAIAVGRQAAFDVASLDDWDWLIGKLDLAEDREPEFTLLERHLGVRAGYLSPLDLLDPALTETGVREGNERALAAVKRWWTESREFLRWDAMEQRFSIDREARDGAALRGGQYAEALQAASGAERVRIADEGRRHAAVVLAFAGCLAETRPGDARWIFADLLARLGAGAVPEFGAECVAARQALERLK